MDFALWMECSALSDINYETMNSGNTMTLSVNPIVEKCLAKMANDVTTQVRDKLIDIIIAVLTRECEDFDGETVRRLIFAELESTPIAFAVEKHVAAASKTPKTPKTPKTKVVELDADGNTVKKVRTPKEPKEKAPKAAKEPKPVLTEEEREARKAAKQAEKEAAKEARKAEKEATKDADKEALKAAAKAEKEAAKLAKPAKEQRLPIPWCGKRIDGRCEALRAYHGLFAQCTADATEISAFCPSCQKSGAPFGTVTMRLACGIFDYTAPNGKKCVRLANVLDKFEVEGGMDAFVAEAAKLNITIPYEHLDKEVKQRGRPKSVSPRASAAKIATSDSGSETETDDEEYQAKKQQQQQQQQRKKVTKTAAAAAADAAPKKRGRPAKAKEAAPEPTDSLIQDLVASAKKSTPVTPTTSTPVTATPELSEDVITITPISSPAAAAAAVAPAAPKKTIKPKAAPKVARKVVELDGDKFWEESFEGMELYVRCSDNIAFDSSNGNGVGTWDDKTKTLIEDNDSENEE